MNDLVVFCPGPSLEIPPESETRSAPPAGTWCGNYTTIELAQRPRKGKPWHKLPARHPYDIKPRFACDACFVANARARVRALIANGALRDGLDLSSLSAHERQAAAEVLGPEFVAAVDKGWEDDRRETPPFGIPMGVARNGLWALVRRVPVKPEPAFWTTAGRGAGPIRNGHMLVTHKPDLVVAFPGGRGTDDLTGRAGVLGFDVLWIDNTGEGHERLVRVSERAR